MNAICVSKTEFYFYLLYVEHRKVVVIYSYQRIDSETTSCGLLIIFLLWLSSDGTTVLSIFQSHLAEPGHAYFQSHLSGSGCRQIFLSKASLMDLASSRPPRVS